MSCTLPVSKLYNLPTNIRLALKMHRITTCEQLLQAAALYEDREALAQMTCLDVEALTAVVQRADRARINGIGTSFSRMLPQVDVHDVATLAIQNPRTLQLRLHALNQAERLVRRVPTLDEIIGWVDQAQRLPAIVSYTAANGKKAIRRDAFSRWWTANSSTAANAHAARPIGQDG